MTGLRRALMMIGATAFVAGLLTIPLTVSTNHAGSAGLFLASQLVIGWSFVGTGLFMWWRRPANRLGLYMTAVGFTWLFGSLLASNDGYIFFVGELVAGLPYAFLVQMLLSFPDGRLHSRLEQAIVGATWFDALVMQWLALPWLQFSTAPHCGGCPANPLLINDSSRFVDVVSKAQAAIAVAVVIGLVIALVRRRRAMAPTQRRTLTPVLWTGALAMVVFTSALAAKLSGIQTPAINTLYEAGLIPFAAVPYAFLVGLMRSRFTRADAVSELVATLSAEPDRRRHGLRESLADAFGDPTLVLAYWLPERMHYVDAEGHRIELPEPGGGRAWTPITHDGAQVAVLIHDAALLEERQLLETAGAAAGLALENERLHAELRARVEELERSRERLIEVGLAERRKLERNLHDGAQQRLVSLALSLRLARDRISRDPDDARELLTESMNELDSATAELRELARGIHPAVLSDRGLPAALRALAGRVPFDVELVEAPEERLPPRVEAASYYVVAEALTNVARYAQADSAAVRVTRTNGSVRVEVSDDGVGGANPAGGSGLRGLADRVAALDGRLEVHSPPGGGTMIRALIPCG